MNDDDLEVIPFGPDDRVPYGKIEPPPEPDEYRKLNEAAERARKENRPLSGAAVFLIVFLVIGAPGMFLLKFADWATGHDRDEETKGPWGGLALIGPFMQANAAFYGPLLALGLLYSVPWAAGILAVTYAVMAAFITRSLWRGR